MPPMATTATTLAVLLAAAASVSSAQTVAPTNSTDTPDYDSDSMLLEMASGDPGTADALVQIVPLTGSAGRDVPAGGLSGPIKFANATNFLGIDSSDIALISCDPSSGNLGPNDFFTTAVDNNATAILFYTETSQWCQPAGFDSYRWIYTLIHTAGTESIMEEIGHVIAFGNHHTAYARISSRQDNSINGSLSDSSSSSGTSNRPTNSLGPSPSTAVAMIILYSITGVITALFLVIIITGAVRAHRHPERYGPRNIVGRPRQGRARGIARAMLDSIPIVKFGDRTEQPAKPGDVELEHGRVEELGDQNAATQNTAIDATTRDSAAQEGNTNGIAAAGATDTTDRDEAAQMDESQGCSICTDDFQVGEDQRVLPCDHRFHPACIDPWLLNVSGTCPLCRIDLRPQEDDTAELDEHGNPVQTEADLAPPLGGGDRQRMSMRRSIMLGIMGIPRPERMTREERLNALRQYRQQHAASAVRTPAEEESSRRRRLRSVFRIRTRRTGDTQTHQDQTAASGGSEGTETTPADAQNRA